ncbi:MAG: PBP1A family penicillin-binding protein [Clostridia bacterium]|nr:PBP1A family penicillin-binding protein [Clostridia bacterium]
MKKRNISEEQTASSSNKMNGKKSVKKVLGRIFLIAVVAGLVSISIVMGALMGFIDNSTDLIAMEYNLDFTSVIYYVDDSGELSEFDRLFSEQNRIWADLADMPTQLKEAFIAIEDERFMTHHGVDWKRTTGAVLKWFTSKDSAYGGSTITQQLIKNVTGDSRRSPIRKVQEMIRALNLERKMSKDEIIEMYMNTIYLGQGCHGVQTAANKYYSKDVSELNLAECASIAGITQYPSRYDPFLNYEAHKQKQELVLGKMLELGYISQEEHDAAVSEELALHEGSALSGAAKIQSYFTDQIVLDVMRDLMEKHKLSESEATKKLFKGGLKIYSTLDPNVQSAMENVFGNYQETTYAENQYQSAMAVLDPKNGHVKGIVGGRGKKTGNRVLNRASQSLRQPGSSIKPIAVYAPAIENGDVTAATVLDDSPLTVGTWSPKNADRTFMGDVAVRVAIEKSRNIPAVKVLQKLTVDKSYDFLTKKLGITSLVDSVRGEDGQIHSDKFLGSLALGGLTKGVSPLEMTAAYAAFANGGVYNKPITYTKVIDSRGMVILENKEEPVRAMSEQTAYIMSNMLNGVMTYGTGSGARIANGQWAGGKTGTSDNDKDKWFVGFTPRYAGGVWSGYDQSQKYGGVSGNPSVSLWKKVMDQIHSGKEKLSLEQPSGLTSRTVCQKSGKLASDICENKRTDYFKSGTQPNAFCARCEEELEKKRLEEEALLAEENGETNAEISPEGQTGEAGGETNTNAENTAPPSAENAPVDDNLNWWDGE